MPKTCRTCSEELSAARLAAIPDAVQCVPCLEANGDEPPVRGHMIWDHKTAPSIEIGTKLAADPPRAHPRESKHTGLSPAVFDRIDTDSVMVTNIRSARCHPERQAVAQGFCPECAVEWYSRRFRG